MKPLPKDLQTPKQNLNEFAEITKRVLVYLPNIVSERVDTKSYSILSSDVAGTKKIARPFNNSLFITAIEAFEEKYTLFLATLEKIKNGEKIKKGDYFLIDSVVYTIQ